MSDSIPHGVPTLDELIEAVEECLRDELLPTSEGRERSLLRLCTAALAQARREIALAADHDADHRHRLAELGVADDVALADEIRSGVDPARRADIIAVLRAQVSDRLAVVSPRHSAAGRQ